jgi:D-tyrosyl-tRNA(Tyr) deacylase
MIGLLQRVTQASVTVDGEIISQIGPGSWSWWECRTPDTEASAKRLLERLLTYRVFPDDEGKMNRSLADTAGGLLLVPQFTLAADTQKGTRPSFSSAAPPEQGRALFDFLAAEASKAHANVHTGRFGADMQVALVNDGPVTFWLETA